MTDLVADLVVVGASEVITCDPSLGEDEWGRIERGAVAVAGEIVLWVGPESELKGSVRYGPATIELDADGFSVVPGFVDAHTHLVFGGDRREEFAARAAGRPYHAGGILKTVADTRAALDADLIATTVGRCEEMIFHGTTTAEAKSGYALDPYGEKRLLEVLAEVDLLHPIDIEPTFLGAHAVPEEFEGRADEYVDLVAREMTPLCAPLARWCDVFCDVGAFTPEQSRKVLDAGMRAGLQVRLHANELESSGGAGLAADLGAASADHLLYLDEGEASALAAAGCVGVLAPTTALSLGRFPDVRMMREQGMTVAIASDLNPGMAPGGNLQMAMSIATRTMSMSQQDALLAVTTGAAAALRRPDIGRIAPGRLADLLVLETDSAWDLGYVAGVNLVGEVIKRGVRL